MSARGLFINFEGGEGSGKTTQLRLVAEQLRSEGREVVEAVEPGGTRIGQQIRRILLDRANTDLRAMPEMLLYFASRAQNVEEVILPALQRGAVVLADRYTDSTMAYQGIARGLGEEVVAQAHTLAGCIDPDLTVLIDIDVDAGLRRVRTRNAEAASTETRLDDEAVEFHRRVRAGYLKMAAREPERFRVIDGSAAPEVVARSVWEAIAPVVARIHV
ncbi:MAG TPA: dTMP kinase [Bryobacteraceae bacterium]|nr:dTMP kinase [Bryobacteraceae bacterium]